MKPSLTSAAILSSLPQLPAFPQIVMHILKALDDDNSSMTVLVNHLQRDPVIAGRILSAANRSSQPGRRALGGISAAVSYIGMRRVREIVLATSLVDFSRKAQGSRFFWEHSLAVGICTQELAREFSLNLDYALVAGLLHDIGKLWMSYLYPKEHQEVLDLIAQQLRPVCEIEREVFGMDHCRIGEVVAEHWGLPADIIEAIGQHHQPDHPELGMLAAITHVAEAISNGLDLPCRDENQVVDLSDKAIRVIGLDWNSDVHDLLGRMDARFRYATTLLQ
ncbi:MAG: HDOD domain-containing protein [Formivibrio sp.]|nr:HDOD domain-containing protein [Formivibrio sp.]